MSKITLEQLGALVRERRGSRGLRETCAEIGVSTATLSRVESGKQPDLDTFSKMCRWLEVNPSEVLGFNLNSEDTIADAPFAQTAYAHFRADQTMKADTAQHLGQLILAVQRSLAARNAGG